MTRRAAAHVAIGIALSAALGAMCRLALAQSSTTFGTSESSGGGIPVSAAPDLPDFSGALFRMLLVVGTLCVALVAALWWIRRRGGAIGGAGRSMRLIETMRIGPGREIVLMEVAGSYLLVGVTPTSMTTLSAEPLDRDALAARLGEPRREDGSISSAGDRGTGAGFARSGAGLDRFGAMRGDGARRGPIEDDAASFASVFHGVPAEAPSTGRVDAGRGGGS